jgi:hypothetical protein
VSPEEIGQVVVRVALWLIAAPAATCIVLWLAASRWPARPDRPILRLVSGPVAFAVALLIGFTGFVGWPSLPPESGYQWPIYLTALAVSLSAVELFSPRAWIWVGWPLRIALLSVSLRLILKTEFLDGAVPTLAWSAPLLCGGLAAWASIGSLATRVPGRTFPAAAAILGLATTVAIASGSFILAPPAIVATSIFVIWTILPFQGEANSGLPSSISVAAIALTSIWFTGYYAYVPVSANLLLGLAPITMWLAWKLGSQRSSSWGRVTLMVGVLVPCAIALVICFWPTSGSEW